MKRAPFLLMAMLMFAWGCAQRYSDQYNYQKPVVLEDGLPVGSIQDVGIDEGPLVTGISQIKKGRFREIHSLLIYKEGKLVLEEYFPGHDYAWEAPGHHAGWVEWNPSTLHNLHSVTKSITSACIGIGIDKGFIQSVDQSIFDYLPDHQLYRSGGREQITIEHLLTMTSGLPWYEWGSRYSNTSNPIVAVWFQDKDPVSFTLDAPMKYTPGNHYSYYSGSQVVLGEILRYASSLNIEEFSRKYLFEPLGIDTAVWTVRYPNGVYEAGGSLKLKPRDMLKIGITYLNDGRWEGKQIVSSEWVKKSTLNYRDFSIDVPGTDGKGLGYGYSWWIPAFMSEGRNIKAFEAGGWGGQKIFVIPELETVVVLTGGTYVAKTRQFKLMEKFIIPALN